ncbi:hypothetical protein ASG25_07300 [Rhizobium sp. Leaf384]|uniref:YdcF family protein n=1 Tax=unclassified Rhizobium TaxID=2613769 RepID=UPI0007133840|nr:MULTISPECIES: YdcF family protein [unclassified Rhizobium]KQS81279.1 hypothetical protein ASG25_07300 [Rhizobium sp. Leaf384]KQS87187.1 hypothetical protein ASG58_02860 [Rhizobium sp. Leaf383]
MFLISKIFWLLAQPLSLAFALVLSGCISTAAGFQRLGLVLSGLSTVILCVTLFTTTGSVLLQRLEDRFPRPPALPADISCLIVLGGAFENEVMATRGGFEFNQAADRFVEALRIARLVPGARILVSGGDGSLSGSFEGDADAAARFFPAFGIPLDRLIREDGSRTTFENAANTKTLLAQKGLSNCLLITSAFHMPRAVGLFRNLDIAVIPWATDYRTTGKASFGLDLTQPALNAQLTTTAVREWIGLLAYALTGRTSTLFPSVERP